MESACPAATAGSPAASQLPSITPNVSNVTCFLWGYPVVTATALGGQQLGHAAAHDDPVQEKNVYLAPGATAHSVLGYVGSDLRPSCAPRPASYLKVTRRARSGRTGPSSRCQSAPRSRRST